MRRSKNLTDFSRIEKHYERFSEGTRLHRSRVRRLEFDTTVHILHQYVLPQATILEMGAGHGAYSLHFARQGHQVLATDLLLGNVQAILAQIEQEKLENVQTCQADATHLDFLTDQRFQAVLCLGPYYHLRSRDLRRLCLLECRRVVDDSGIVAVSYINRAFAVNYLLKLGKGLTKDQYESLMQPDDCRVDYPDEFFNITHFSTAELIETEIRSCGFEIVEHVGTDGVYGFVPEVLEALDEADYLNFRSYHLRTCSQLSQRSASGHCLVILKKA